MSLFDLFRQHNIKGRVLDKYRLDNGNIALIVEQENTGKRYSVEFKDGYKGPTLGNLFKIWDEPFSGKTEYLDRLISKDGYVDLVVSYSKWPLRQAYRLLGVSGEPNYHRQKPPRISYQASTAEY